MALDLHDRYRGDNLRDQLFVRVFTVACVTIGRTWNSRDVCSGYWRLYGNERAGAMLLLPDGGRHVLTAGRVHLVPAGVRFTCHNTLSVRHHYLHFDLIGEAAARIRRLFTKPLVLQPDARLEALVRELPGVGPPEVVLCRAKAAAYAALGAALAGLPAGALAALSVPSPVAAAVRHIDDHLGENLTNRDLAARCHLSEDHFGRVFRSRMGQTPAQYVIERRVAAATQALAFTADSIEQIAERLGFANRFHFTRMFTRRMGIAPAAYRRQGQV
jgi:AraC-like DNA-binding protein